LAQHIVEVDYSLGHILASICQDAVLSETLILKGGTALKKSYYPDYRFSLDLDFTAASGAPSGRAMEEALQMVVTKTQEELLEFGPFTLTERRHEERTPHPRGQEAFDIYIQFPWHRTPLSMIKVEITFDEPLVLDCQERLLFHGYEEGLKAVLHCYSLEEILAEKLRAVLQAQRKLAEKGWVARARDYYDLWQILVRSKSQLNFAILPDLLRRKCEIRDVDFTGVDDFFPAHLLKTVEQGWQRSLSEVVKQPPPFPRMILDLRNLLQDVPIT
jgi:predicted nucleotidyltransferase component of viral defense system